MVLIGAEAVLGREATRRRGVVSLALSSRQQIVLSLRLSAHKAG